MGGRRRERATRRTKSCTRRERATLSSSSSTSSTTTTATPTNVAHRPRTRKGRPKVGRTARREQPHLRPPASSRLPRPRPRHPRPLRSLRRTPREPALRGRVRPRDALGLGDERAGLDDPLAPRLLRQGRPLAQRALLARAPGEREESGGKMCVSSKGFARWAAEDTRD